MADQDRPNAIARARPRRASLRSHLILLVVVTVVPLLIFSGIVFFLFARDERRAMEGGLRETARALRQVVDGRASDVTTTLQALATSEVFDGGNPNDFYRVAARVLPTQEGWKTILLHDASGKPLFNLLRPPGVGPRPMIDRKSFDEALRTKRPVFVGYLTAPNAGPVVGFRVPIVRGGEVRYVITAGIDPKLFADLLLKQKLPPGWVAVVFDRNHRVIARVPEPEKYVGQPVGALFGRLDPSAAEGWLGGLNREGVRSYAAFSRSEADGYTVALMVPAAAIDAPLWRSLWAVAAAGLVFLALGVSLATVVGRRIAEPIKSLASSAQALGRGEAPLPRPASTVQELEALGKSIEESGRLLEDRRLIEQARWESEQRLGAIFSQLTVGIAECDLEGRFLLVNHRYSEIVGRSPEDLLAMRLQDIVHPEDLARHLDQYRRVIAGEAIALIEKRYVCPNGDTVWVSGGMSVVSDVSGSPQYVVSVSQDVSDRKRAEEELYRLKDELEHRVVQRTEELTRTNVELFRTLDQREKLEAQLRQAHKMEAIGALAGGIAHDFNNLLGIIAVHASALAEESAAPLEAAEQARAILEASQRGAALVQQLLTFAQEKTIEHKRVDLNGLISDLMRMMVNTFPRTVAFALELDPEIPPILADQNQLEQALLNLCLNARDAMVEGGKISLRTARLSGEEVRRTHPEAGEKEYVRVEVADTGPGMDDETRNRIFEPFFTTKKDTGGTGLGLPVVYGIVGSHRGLIDVESAKGKGSAFRIYLPVSAAESAAGEKGEESAGLAGPAGRILVVEDEKNLLQLIQSVLKKNRYEVFTATHGEQAIEIFRRHKDAVDLVLLDLGLPGGMDGRKVYDKLKEESPRVTVIVSTGYLDPEVRIDLIKKGVNGFLQKPLTPMMILQKIRSVLERQSTLAKRGKTDALAS